MNTSAKDYLEHMFGKEWFRVLKPFLRSVDFIKLTNELKDYLERGAMTPNMPDVFRAFRECPLDTVHTVIMGLEPYPGYVINSKNKTLADGLAFSSKDSPMIPKELSLIYDNIDKTIYQGQHYDITDTCDLKKWAKQGILLLNSSLTSAIGAGRVHLNIWKKFTIFAIAALKNYNPEICAILMGEEAQNYQTVFPSTAFVLKCDHPSSATHRYGIWEHNNVFKELDAYLSKKHNINIDW